ncbi:MAG: hypothetical protein ACRDP6_06935 [Actinoallomurus sp.]
MERGENADRPPEAHRAVLAHRQWFLDTVRELLAQIREAPAKTAARHFVTLRDPLRELAQFLHRPHRHRGLRVRGSGDQGR